MKGEIVSINIGQAGVQLAESCWELYCLEHGVEPDGRMKWNCTNEYHQTTRFHSIFSETEKSIIVPRAMFIDLEPTVIDVVRSGRYKSLFHPNTFLSGKEDAANNFARGYYGVGREALEVAVERIEKLVEDCDQLQGFLISHSLGGGTGSGFTAILAQALSQLFPKKSKIHFIVYPSPHLSTSMVEPYNSLLTTHCTMDHSDCSFLFDNEAIYKICHDKLKVSRPMYKNLNQIISHVLSSITAPLRFDGSLQVSLTAFQTNLVPYPRIHFPLVTYSPLMTDMNILRTVVSIQHLTNQCFSPQSQMVICSPQMAKYMACCLLYRGDICPSKINNALQTIKRSNKVHFVDWCPTGFKLGINSQPPVTVPGSDIGDSVRAVCMLSNTTAIGEAWERLDYKFDLMFRKKAFIHWYISEGMTLDEFTETRENMAALEQDYREVGAETKIDENGEVLEEY